MNINKLINTISKEIAEDIQDTYEESINELTDIIMQEQYSVPSDELDAEENDDIKIVSRKEAITLILNKLNLWMR